MSSVHQEFKKIFIYPYDTQISKLWNETYNINVCPMDFEINNITVKYPRFKNMSTGLITYHYIKNIKHTDDRIVLVGFTSQVNKYFHSSSWESRFFRQEVEKGCCELIW